MSWKSLPPDPFKNFSSLTDAQKDVVCQRLAREVSHDVENDARVYASEGNKPEVKRHLVDSLGYRHLADYLYTEINKVGSVDQGHLDAIRWLEARIANPELFMREAVRDYAAYDRMVAQQSNYRSSGAYNHNPYNSYATARYDPVAEIHRQSEMQLNSMLNFYAGQRRYY